MFSLKDILIFEFRLHCISCHSIWIEIKRTHSKMYACYDTVGFVFVVLVSKEIRKMASFSVITFTQSHTQGFCIQTMFKYIGTMTAEPTTVNLFTKRNRAFVTFDIFFLLFCMKQTTILRTTW